MYGNNQKDTIKISELKLVHYLACVVLFYFCWILFRYGTYALKGVGYRYNYYVAIGYAVFLLLFNRTYNAYLLGFVRVRSLIFSQFLAQFFSVVIIWVGVTVAWRKIYNPWTFFVMLGIQLIIDIVWSNIATKIYYKRNKPKKTILIYRNPIDKQRFSNIKGKPIEKLYSIEKELQFDGSFKELKHQLSEYEAIFVAGLNSRCRNGILKYCKEHDIPGYFLPHVGDVIMQEAQHIQSFDSPVLYVNKKVLAPEYMAVKRAFDLVMSSLGIIILSPLLLITALAIKIYDGGPAIYKQIRLTKDGKRFKILKFRSMRVDAEKDGVARLSQGENDDRITPIGKIVRKCRLDELPQLFNIFIGDMSFVGPRPERQYYGDLIQHQVPTYALLHQVRPGITSLGMVKYGYAKNVDEMIERLNYDLIYLENMSLINDVKIMVYTIKIVITGRGI